VVVAAVAVAVVEVAADTNRIGSESVAVAAVVAAQAVASWRRGRRCRCCWTAVVGPPTFGSISSVAAAAVAAAEADC
jgi:hypothetical protein